MSNHCQCTRVGNSLSGFVAITSGVIQGSCIGPLLFLLFINSVTKVFNQDVMCILFADEVKLYSVIRSSYDFVNLQSGSII